jgi:hypothetical protein
MCVFFSGSYIVDCIKRPQITIPSAVEEIIEPGAIVEATVSLKRIDTTSIHTGDANHVSYAEVRMKVFRLITRSFSACQRPSSACYRVRSYR